MRGEGGGDRRLVVGWVDQKKICQGEDQEWADEILIYDNSKGTKTSECNLESKRGQ